MKKYLKEHIEEEFTMRSSEERIFKKKMKNIDVNVRLQKIEKEIEKLKKKANKLVKNIKEEKPASATGTGS